MSRSSSGMQFTGEGVYWTIERAIRIDYAIDGRLAMASIKTRIPGTTRSNAKKNPKKKPVLLPDLILREYAGKYVAWAPDGLRIVAVASSFGAAERKAAKVGYPMAAVARVPKGRTVN